MPGSRLYGGPTVTATKTKLSDLPLALTLSKDHSLLGILICENTNTGKVQGVQARYGIFKPDGSVTQVKNMYPFGLILDKTNWDNNKPLAAVGLKTLTIQQFAASEPVWKTFIGTADITTMKKVRDDPTLYKSWKNYVSSLFAEQDKDIDGFLSLNEGLSFIG